MVRFSVQFFVVSPLCSLCRVLCVMFPSRALDEVSILSCSLRNMFYCLPLPVAEPVFTSVIRLVLKHGANDDWASRSNRRACHSGFTSRFEV